jgi:hypothetical protein
MSGGSSPKENCNEKAAEQNNAPTASGWEYFPAIRSVDYSVQNYVLPNRMIAGE